jgi:hypothetical protein
MSTIRSRAERTLAGLLLAGLLTGAPACTLREEPSPDDPSDGARSVQPRDVVGAVTRALAARASAVRGADEAAFRAGLGGGPAFRHQQQTWFDNLAQLPIQRLGYRVDPRSLVRDGTGYWVTVGVRLQLEGFDELPAVAPDRYRFAAVPHHPARYRLTSTTDPAWEAAHPVQAQPWDRGPVQVQEVAGVLGIFDAGSVDAANILLPSIEDGIVAVSAVVPFEWPRSVVVYALSDPGFLTALEDVPGDDPGDLDAVAFPVSAGRGTDEVAGTRFVLNPTVLRRPGPERPARTPRAHPRRDGHP